MRPSQTNNPSSLRIHRNANGIHEWSYTHMSNLSILRFQRLQTLALLSAPDDPMTFPACLVCLDGVRPDDLKNIQKSFQIFRSAEGDLIEWTDNKTETPCRHVLSPFTVLAAQYAGHEQNLVTLFDSWLRQSQEFGSESDRWTLAGQDQMCWMSVSLPASLFSIAARLSPWHPVPRSTLARRDTDLALVEEPVALEDGDIDTDLGATDIMVQAAMESLGEANNQGLLMNVFLILRKPRSSRIAGWVKRQWISDLHDLSNKVGRSHPALGMTIGWVIHMCEAGTLTTPNPSLKTIRAYCRIALRKIAAALVTWSTDLDAWTSKDLAALYTKLLASVNASMRGNMASALGSFHAYLVEWFDMDPLAIRLNQYVVPAAVSANVIWPHESALAIDWALQCPDERMGQITACMLAIAREQGVRLQDLRRLNLRNVQFHAAASGRYVTLEIVKDARRGRLKTDNAQRRLVVRDPRSVSLLESWYQRRLKELALLKSPLFGDAQHDHHLYKPAQVHAYANRLLKAVTGCAAIRFHHLRHTAISNQTDVIHRSCATTDVNPLEELACRSGHGTPQTTLCVYSHLHEQAIRLWLDIGLLEKLELTGKQAEALTGIKSHTMRQMMKRRQRSRLKLVWEQVEKRAAAVPLESSAQPFSIGMPVAPQLRSQSARNLTPVVVADALLRHLAGESDRKLSILLDMDTDDIRRWLQEFKSYLMQRFLTQHPRLQPSTSHDVADLFTSLGVKPELLFKPRGKVFAIPLAGHIDDDSLKEAIVSWERCTHGHYISLENPAQTRGLFALLHKLPLNPRCPRVFLEDPRDDPSLLPGTTMQMEIERVFKQEFGLRPVCEPSQDRIGRPKSYLKVNADADAPSTPNALSINPHLKIWLLACQAYLLAKAQLEKK